MKKSLLPYILLLLSFSVFTILFGRVFFRSELFVTFHTWVSGHALLFSIFLFLIKVIGIVWPPLPGGLFTLGAVPLIGWKWAFTIDLVGNLVGSLIAFSLAKRYGKELVQKLFPVETLMGIKKTKIKPEHEMEIVFLLSLLTGLVMAEIASYGFGLIPVKTKNFLIGNSTAHITRNAPLFVLFGTLTGRGSFFVMVLLFAIVVPLLIIARKRYFEIVVEEK